MPVLFAAMLNANRTKGPAEIPAKRIYTWKHVVRLANDQGLTITPPPAHPFNPLLSLRVATAVNDPRERAKAVDTLFEAAWERGLAITEPAQVEKWLNAAGLPGTEWLHAGATVDAKQQLKDTTAWAMEKGVFGVPSYVVGEEVFWGQDSVPHVAAHLRGEDPAAGELERWRNLPVGVERPGSQ